MTAANDTRMALGQFNTPDWAAQELVDRYFGDLTMFDRVLEPSCGGGAFLRAIPSHVPALGVEIDPVLAHAAERSSGRPVVIGDFRSVDITFHPTLLVGNPPFKQQLIQAFISRAWDLLPEDGRAGFVLPCFAFQTASVVANLSKRWSLRQEMLPRNIFNRLSMPLCFAILTKGAQRNLYGFALYHETDAVARLRKRYRQILEQGERSVWAAVVTAALESLGGAARLESIYREIEGARPTSNPFWKEKVRQCLQASATRIGRGMWALSSASKPSVLCA